MINMKMTKSEKNEQTALSEPGGNDYPYGLALNLDHDSMDKLGLKDLPDVGSKMVIQAIAEVVSVGANATKESESRYMTLQITDMDLSSTKKQNAGEEILYGKR